MKGIEYDNSKRQGFSFSLNVTQPVCLFACHLVCLCLFTFTSMSFSFSCRVPHNLEANVLLLTLYQDQALISLCLCLGTYKSEENQLLLKVYQVKGPTEHYYSKFKNDNWAMDGHVRQTSLFFYIKHFKLKSGFARIFNSNHSQYPNMNVYISEQQNCNNRI